MTDLNQQLEDKKKEELRERLAELEHKQWSHWTKYMLDELYGLFDLDTLNRNCKPVQSLRRWQKQMKTEYKDLTEKEKDSDREWADKVLEQAIAEINSLQVELKAWDGFLQTQIYNNSVLIDEHKIEMQKQRQEILKLIKQEISKDAYSYTFECRLNDFLKNGLKKQLNQPKTEKKNSKQ